MDGDDRGRSIAPFLRAALPAVSFPTKPPAFGIKTFWFLDTTALDIRPEYYAVSFMRFSEAVTSLLCIVRVNRPRSDMCPSCCYRDICGGPQVAVASLFSAQWRKFSGGLSGRLVFFFLASCQPSLMGFRRLMTPRVRQMTRVASSGRAPRTKFGRVCACFVRSQMTS